MNLVTSSDSTSNYCLAVCLERVKKSPNNGPIILLSFSANRLQPTDEFDSYDLLSECG